MLTSKGLLALICALMLSALGSASAQAPAPRDVPEGFVLPGPPPTNASPNAPPGAMLPGTAPQPSAAAPAGSAPSASPAGATPPSVSGTMVTAPSSLAPGAGTTQLLGSTGGSTARHQWPCVQRKVDHVQAGQVWPGPPLDAAKDVERTAAMRQLVQTIAARRLPLPDAEKTAVEFLGQLPDDARAAGATAVFADLLSTLDAERTDVMRGIERYGARQQALAEKLREQNTELSDIRAKGDTAKAAEAQEALIWDTRVFDERRRSLTFVCEVPTLIEQRLFALGRAMSGAL